MDPRRLCIVRPVYTGRPLGEFSVSTELRRDPSSSFPSSSRVRMDPERRLRALIFLEVLIAIVLPPLGVFLRHGCRVEFWICLLLTILGYVPGIIYAIYAIVVINRDRHRYDYYQPIVA